MLLTQYFYKECWRVVNSAEVGGGVVVVLWDDVGRLCTGFLFGRCYRELRPSGDKDLGGDNV